MKLQPTDGSGRIRIRIFHHCFAPSVQLLQKDKSDWRLPTDAIFIYLLFVGQTSPKKEGRLPHPPSHLEQKMKHHCKRHIDNRGLWWIQSTKQTDSTIAHHVFIFQRMCREGRLFILPNHPFGSAHKRPHPS